MARDLREWADVREKDVLVLNTTMACPLSCSFCCYGCHPKRKETMPVDRALSLIDQAAALDCFSSIGFTGGEPFMHLDDLLAMTARAAENGIPFTAATSGHWGENAASSQDLAATLHRQGLRRINLSCDEAHADFVPPRSVINAALAVAAFDIPVYVVGTFDDPAKTLEWFLPELAGHPGIQLVSKVVAKVGKARKWDIDYEAARHKKVTTCYRRVHHDIVVFWDGRAYPCCSTFNRATGGIVIGNAFSEPLARIRARVEASYLFRTLKQDGFPELYRIVAKYDPELLKDMPDFAHFPGACSACNAIFGKRAIADRVTAVFDLYQRDEIDRAIDGVTSRLGEEKAALFFAGLLEQGSEQQEGPV